MKERLEVLSKGKGNLWNPGVLFIFLKKNLKQKDYFLLDFGLNGIQH